LEDFFFPPFGVRDGTQGLAHARQVLYYEATFPAQGNPEKEQSIIVNYLPL
jgi:hypothetical protein